MVSHPELGSDSLIGSDRGSGYDTSPADEGLALHLHSPYQAFPHCDRLRGEGRDHAPWSGYFLLLHQRLGGRRGVAAPPMEWYCSLNGLLCILWALHLSGEFRQIP